MQCKVALACFLDRRGSRGRIWGFIPPPPPPLNYLEMKIIKNVNGKKRLALKFSQEIRRETRISNFNLKVDLVSNIYVWRGGIFGGDMFRIIYLRGLCVPHYTP